MTKFSKNWKWGHLSGALMVNWYAWERRLAWKKGVMTAAHPHTTCQCGCPPGQRAIKCSSETVICLKKEHLIIERCSGQFKSRFPVLQGRVGVHLNLVPSVIVACCIMYNVAKYYRILMISLIIMIMWIYYGSWQSRCWWCQDSVNGPKKATPTFHTLNVNAFFELCVFFSYMHRGKCKCRVKPSFINLCNKWPPEKTSCWVTSDNTPAAIA